MRAAILAAALLGWPAWAGAHAYVDHAEPRVGADVAAAPRAIRIWFTDELNPPGCRIQVFDSSGKEIDGGDTRIDAGDDTLMSVSLPALAAGEYRVVWNARCPAGHKTHGEYKFTLHAP